MQFVHHADQPGNASVMFLPIIDMNSSDTTCIYSTMAFVTEHARRHVVSPIDLVYAHNALVHMLNGKALAVRVHFIVDAALNALMLTNVLNDHLPI